MDLLRISWLSLPVLLHCTLLFTYEIIYWMEEPHQVKRLCTTTSDAHDSGHLTWKRDAAGCGIIRDEPTQAVASRNMDKSCCQSGTKQSTYMGGPCSAHGQDQPEQAGGYSSESGPVTDTCRRVVRHVAPVMRCRGDGYESDSFVYSARVKTPQYLEVTVTSSLPRFLSKRPAASLPRCVAFSTQRRALYSPRTY